MSKGHQARIEYNRLKQLEQEVKELKAQAEEQNIRNALISGTLADVVSAGINPKTRWATATDMEEMTERVGRILALPVFESLAQHDKEVTENAVVNFCCYILDNGELIPEEVLQQMGSDFLEQLQEQGNE